MSGAPEGTFFSKETLVEHNDDFEQEDIVTSLDYYCEEGILEEYTARFCLVSDTQMDMDDEKGIYYCDTCCTHYPEVKSEPREGYIVKITVHKPRNEFEDFKDIPEFEEFKKRLLMGIPRFVHSLKKVPPHFLKESMEKNKNTKEEDFRDEMLRSVSFVFDSEGEAIRGGGRSDLLITGPDKQLDRVIGEFKVWPRNDYEQVVDQLLKYFTQFDDIGFVFMVNENKKNCILNDYLKIVKKNKTYIKDSHKENPILNNKSLKHFLSKHRLTGGREVFVYHFVFDVNLK